jgi:hypothetical protein
MLGVASYPDMSMTALATEFAAYLDLSTLSRHLTMMVKDGYIEPNSRIAASTTGSTRRVRP